MPMGLTNAPAVFQHMINDVLRDYLDIFVVAYLDDLLIFSANPIEHEHHVKKVLTRLRESGLFAKLEKCHFNSTEVEFLGYMVTPHGVFMDPAKIRALTAWEPPHTLRAVQSFLGFANFYRRFIKGFSSLVLPLTALTRKTSKSPFVWSMAAQEAFEALKRAFTTAPILQHADPMRPFVLETDASDYALGAVLSQSGRDGLLHPIAYHSRKFTAAEINYEIYDKELLAIVDSFEVWRHFLEGAQHPITVFTDHKNLLYFTTSRVLNRRQARWSISLSRFDFQLHYRPGPLQGKPDALSRQAAYAPKIGDESYEQQRTILLKPDCFHGLIASSSFTLCSARIAHLDDPLLPAVRDGLVNDVWAHKLMARLQDPSLPPVGQEKLEDFEVQDGLLYFRGLLYVPEGEARLQVLQHRHDTRLAGHFGIHKTADLVARDYWWPQQWKFVKEFVRSCDTCARSKAPRHRPYGLLQPLPVPFRPWASLTMDFITDLPLSDGADAVMVIVERLTKMSHFIPCNKAITAEQTADLFIHHVLRLHGLPEEVISDRGPQFVSKFWKRMLELLGVTVKLSSAFHPQTDGQSECMNQVLEQYLCCMVDYQQVNWNQLLPLAEFAYNNTVQVSTDMSPF